MTYGAHGGSGSLVIASNRLPWAVRRGPQGLERRRSAGGLASLLDPVLRKQGGCWVGWPGTNVAPDEIQDAAEGYRLVPVQLDDSLRHDEDGFSKGALWPLLHSFSDRAVFAPRDWQTYRERNERFAESVLQTARKGDIVFVHDDHLMLLPGLLRAERPDLRSVFFLHVPFPCYDLLTLMPGHEKLLRGLLGSDLIGFQIPAYALSFGGCAERCLDAAVDRAANTVTCGGRVAAFGAFPIGVDWSELVASALRAPALPSRSQRREYHSLKCEIDELVGRVTGRFATDSWSPIHYLCRSFARDDLAALYRDADVAMVTPLRDGMNLLAKEYVACQVRDSGVLVLA